MHFPSQQNNSHRHLKSSIQSSNSHTNSLIKKIQNYTFCLTDVIGKGNYSHVYKATDQITNDTVAIKVIDLNRPNKDIIIQFLYSQIQILKSLSHPNLLKFYEAFSSNHNFYIVTEYCNQKTLQTKIKEFGHLSEIESYKIIYQIYCGLRYLSQQGIIHRDLKIANILIKDGRIKIADFGFAKRIRQKIQDASIGSPIYMSPEGLLQNIYGPKTDIWAFGIIIYQILHGKTPLSFCKNQSDLKTNIVVQITMDKMDIKLSRQIKQFILRCLDVNQKSRMSLQQMERSSFIVKLTEIYGEKVDSNILISNVRPINFQNNFYNQNDNNFHNSVVSTQITGENLSQNYSIKPQKVLKFKQNKKNLQTLPQKPYNNQQKFKNKKILENLLAKQQTQKQFLNNPQLSEVCSPRIHKNSSEYFNIINAQTYFPTRRKNLSFQTGQYTQFNTPKIQSRRGVSLERYPMSQKMNKKKEDDKNKGINRISNESFKQLWNKNRQGKEREMKRRCNKILQEDYKISFEQCVSFLHYCRLIYKTIMLIKQLRKYYINIKQNGFQQYQNCLIIWLFKFLQQIQQNTLLYRHQSIKQKKLEQVISQYYSKYYQQLASSIKKKQSHQLQIYKIQQFTLKIIIKIDSILSVNQYYKKLEIEPCIFQLFHYLYLILQNNILLENSKEMKDWSIFENNNKIEKQLNQNQNGMGHKKQKQNSNYTRYLKQKGLIKKLMQDNF